MSNWGFRFEDDDGFEPLGQEDKAKKPICEDALALFPSRVLEKDVKAEDMSQTDDEVSSYNPKAHVARVPVGDNAYERTMRLHEALHAIYSNDRVPKTFLGQTCEDLRLHLNKANLTGDARRDEIRAAVDDLRAIKEADSYSLGRTDSDMLLGVFLRAIAILKGHSGWTPSSKAGRYSKLIKDAYKNIKAKEKSKLGQSLKKAFESIANEDSIVPAMKTLKKHMIRPDVHPKQAFGGQGKNQGGGGKEGEAIINQLMETSDSSDCLGDNWLRGFSKDGEFAKIKLPKKLKFDPNNPPHKVMATLHRKKLVPKVRLHRLNLTHPKKAKAEQPKHYMAFSGSKIRAKKLAAAMTSPVPIRLFKRKRKNKNKGVGGTILIDASGSMGIGDAQLDRLMELCPMGSIAYYDGVDDGADPEAAELGGDIVVVAERGKQCDLEASHRSRPVRHGENQIDLQAMQWMMTQPKPWWYLTDGHFTGGCSGFAKDLLHALLAKKIVRQVTSAKEMEKILKDMQEKGDLTSDYSK